MRGSDWNCGETRTNIAGDTKINTKYGELELLNALFVPHNDGKQLSVDRATDADFEVRFKKKHGAIILNPDGETVLTARKVNGLYIVNDLSPSPNQRTRVISNRSNNYFSATNGEKDRD